MLPESILDRLAARTPIEEPVALLAAHPDDEAIGAGAMLALFRRLVIVHVTDGAPRNLTDAAAHGFADTASYAAARRAELGRALEGIPAELVELGVPDQGASSQMVPLTLALRTVLHHRGISAVLTHPYEGGHPDHDAASFIAAHCGVPVIEFTSYHAGPGDSVTVGEFLPGPAGIRVRLTEAERQQKRAMLACFTTQAATLAPFGSDWEAFRLAPQYDFTLPPHEGTLNYDRYDWGMTGERWRALAATAHRALC